MAAAVRRVRAGSRLTRDLLSLGQRVLLVAVRGTTVLLLPMVVMLREVITDQILRPLRCVERYMWMTRQSGSLALLHEERRNDEVGSLCRSTNSMLRQLKDLREQIEVQSFALGRSESALAMMHNVRNALNRSAPS